MYKITLSNIVLKKVIFFFYKCKIYIKITYARILFIYKKNSSVYIIYKKKL